MSNDIAISVRNLTKTYRLYENHADRVKEAFHPFRKQYHRIFNALTNVEFEVRKGETLGIIGRNGSGKSTLLQIICRILKPTSGEVLVNGRISALLELGTGFNPEFSGIQNIYVNGSILGLTKVELDERFDDIAAFADIGDFISQPVKSYSSGMVVRLAFAVAISINPDILVIDEALAVGDEAFQRKCFTRIKQIQETGGTILFVSHGAETIVQLCNRAILLDQGELILCGSPKHVISRYHKLIFSPLPKIEKIKNEWKLNPNRFNLGFEDVDDCKENELLKKDEIGDQKLTNEETDMNSFYIPDMIPKSSIYYQKRGACIENPHIITLGGRKVNVLVNRGEYIYTYSVYFENAARQVRFGMLIKTISGLEIAGHVSASPGEGIEYIEKGTKWRIAFHLKCLFNPGTYFLNAGVLGIMDGTEVFLDRNVDIAMFRVQGMQNFTSTAIVNCIELAELANI